MVIAVRVAFNEEKSRYSLVFGRSKEKPRHEV
jgi:hypothetical protein